MAIYRMAQMAKGHAEKEAVVEMTDPCETCLRWPECNGVDAENCPVVTSEKTEEE